MILSDFGKKLTAKSGILQLMDDLGKPLPPGIPAYQLGGGNPARIAQVEQVYRSEMQALLANGDSFENAIARYDAPQGRQSFIEAVAHLLSIKFGWKITSENIALTNGSQSAFFYLFNLFSGKTSHKDGRSEKRTILFPLIPEYIGYADQGIEPNTFVSIPSRFEFSADKTFKYYINMPLLEDYLACHPEVGAMCVSRPTNPTGNVLTDKEIRHLADLAKKYDIPLLVDNAYGLPFPNIVFTDEATPIWDESIVLGMSLSKIGLPTLRTGIIVGPKEVINALSCINAIAALAPGSIGPVMAEKIIRSGEILIMADKFVKPFYQYKSNLAQNWVHEFFEGCDYGIHKSEGALFNWLLLNDLAIPTIELYAKLKQRGLITVPGEYFFFGDHEQKSKHPHYNKCLRINYSRPEDEVREGLRILSEVYRENRGNC